jgi:NADH:ubiquinone oxidoreductase subunit E
MDLIMLFAFAEISFLEQPVIHLIADIAMIPQRRESRIVTSDAMDA